MLKTCDTLKYMISPSVLFVYQTMDIQVWSSGKYIILNFWLKLAIWALCTAVIGEGSDLSQNLDLLYIYNK